MFEQKTPRPQTDDEREAESLSNNLYEMVPHLPEIIPADINNPDKYIVKKKFPFQTDHPYSRTPIEIVPGQSPKISTPNQKLLAEDFRTPPPENRDSNKEASEIDPDIMQMEISDQERQELSRYITEDLDLGNMDVDQDQDKSKHEEFLKPKAPDCSLSKTPRRALSPQKRKSRNDKARRYSYSSTPSRSSRSSRSLGSSTSRPGSTSKSPTRGQRLEANCPKKAEDKYLTSHLTVSFPLDHLT